MTLAELSIKYGSDKHYHGYTYMYDLLFDHLKNDVKNILEIGIQYGYSLSMWHDYFPRSIIHGIDIVPIDMKNDRIKTYVGSQNDVNFLDSLCNIQYDIIIDDKAVNPSCFLGALDLQPELHKEILRPRLICEDDDT